MVIVKLDVLVKINEEYISRLLLFILLIRKFKKETDISSANYHVLFNLRQD